MQTLIDNYEWNFAWLLKFGIFAWDEKKSPDYRHFRPGCQVSAALLQWFRLLGCRWQRPSVWAVRDSCAAYASHLLLLCLRKA